MELLEVASPNRLGSLSTVRSRFGHFSLTFDDGPTPERSLPILEALAQHDATATFFVLLRNARANPNLVERIVREGHEIALHGADHRRLRTVPPQELTSLLARARDELEDVTGRRVRWYRPPYGEQTIDSWRATRRIGLIPVVWSRTSWDWDDVAAGTRVEAACLRPRAGLIVLLHDGHAGPEDLAERAPEPELDRYALVSAILSRYGAKGLQSRTLSELTDGGKPVYRPHFDLRLRR